MHVPVRAGSKLKTAGGPDAVRSELVDTSAGEDPTLEGGPGLVGRGPGPAGAVVQALAAEFLVATPPLVGALTGDAHGLSGVGAGLTGLNALAQQRSTGGRQRSITAGREDLRVGELASTPAHLHTYIRRSSFLWTPTVNNVRGKYT
jgi:hypothetical protein